MQIYNYTRVWWDYTQNIKWNITGNNESIYGLQQVTLYNVERVIIEYDSHSGATSYLDLELSLLIHRFNHSFYQSNMSPIGILQYYSYYSCVPSRANFIGCLICFECITYAYLSWKRLRIHHPMGVDCFLFEILSTNLVDSLFSMIFVNLYCWGSELIIRTY